MAGCGGCLAGDAPSTISVPAAASTYYLDDGWFEFRGGWSQALFPNTPCTDPHEIYWEYFLDTEPGGGAWRRVGAPSAFPHVALKAGQASFQLAVAGVTYVRDVAIQTPGNYRLRIARECGAGFESSEVVMLARRKQRVYF